GIDHVTKFVSCIERLNYRAKLQFYGDYFYFVKEIPCFLSKNSGFTLCEFSFPFLPMFLVFLLQNSKRCTTFAPRIWKYTSNFACWLGCMIHNHAVNNTN